MRHGNRELLRGAGARGGAARRAAQRGAARRSRPARAHYPGWPLTRRGGAKRGGAARGAAARRDAPRSEAQRSNQQEEGRMAKRRESGAVAGPRTVSYRIVGESALYYSRPFPPDAKRAVDEGHDAFDERMWRERCHWESDDPQARAVVSGAQLKRSFTAAAKFRGEKIPGMGGKTWGKGVGGGGL